MVADEIQMRVYYEDTDAGGIVYYANYFKFAERGRTEFLRSRGFANTSLRETEGLIFVVAHLEADYRSPARLDDLLTVRTQVSELGNASFTMKQGVFCGEKPLCDMSVTLACVNMQGRSMRLPDNLRTILNESGE